MKIPNLWYCACNQIRGLVYCTSNGQNYGGASAPGAIDAVPAAPAGNLLEAIVPFVKIFQNQVGNNRRENGIQRTDEGIGRQDWT